jgi:NitT/TauT family transport system substrate-binding protein
MKLMGNWLVKCLGALGCAALVLAAPLAAAQGKAAPERPKIRAGSLTLPVLNPIIVNILKDRGFDAKHGFDMEIKPYPSISAFYAALATGEVDTLIGGPIVLQKMRNEGARVKIAATGLRLSDLVIVTSNPGVKSFADLKGKQLAADMGSQQYQVVSLYARSKGLNLGSDVTVVNANFGLARSQLAAGRVEAAMVIEPIATMMLRENKDLRMIFNGSSAWKEMTGRDGWQLVVAVHEDFVKRQPDGTRRLIAALQDVAGFIRTNTDDADRIAAQSVKLPAGVLKDAVQGKRWEFEVLPAWTGERKAIWDMFERAVGGKYIDKLPDEGIIYTP